MVMEHHISAELSFKLKHFNSFRSLFSRCSDGLIWHFTLVLEINYK